MRVVQMEISLFIIEQMLGFPDDAEILNIWQDNKHRSRRTAAILVECPEFPVVGEACVPPLADPLVTATYSEDGFPSCHIVKREVTDWNIQEV